MECTLRICKRREVKTQDADIEENKGDTEAKDAADVDVKAKSSRPATDGAAAEEKEFEVMVLQEWLLQDCYITSISSGCSGGEDRPTENVTVDFSRMQYCYTDHQGAAPRGGKGQIPSKTICYDSLRGKGAELDKIVAGAINDQYQLAPTSSVVLDYLNLRSKPNTTNGSSAALSGIIGK